MGALQFVLLGVVLTILTFVALGWYLTWSSDRASARHVARLHQLQAERRIQHITMAAVQQLLDTARTRGGEQ